MRKAWEEVARYAAANAENPRKGYRLGELTTDEVLGYAMAEAFELARAPDDVSEMADLMGCLFHYAQRKGWSMELIERELIRKLALRFPGVVSPKTRADGDRPTRGKIKCNICRMMIDEDTNCDTSGGNP